MKRESINSNESQLNDDMLHPLIDDMLRERQEGIDRVNKMFGTDIKVTFNSAWEANELEEKATHDHMIAESIQAEEAAIIPLISDPTPEVEEVENTIDNPDSDNNDMDSSDDVEQLEEVTEDDSSDTINDTSDTDDMGISTGDVEEASEIIEKIEEVIEDIEEEKEEDKEDEEDGTKND